MNGYFIGPDAHDDLWVWRERGDYPVPVLGRRDLRDDLELWDAIVAAVEGDPLAAAEARAEAAERKVAAGLALADEYAQSGSPYLLDRDVIVGDLRAALDTAADPTPGCRWSEARQRWESVIRPGVSKEACGHDHTAADPDTPTPTRWEVG